MKSPRCVVPAVILILFCLAHTLYAAPPSIISYQGYLNDGAGKPVTTATNLTFSLYSTASGVGPVWTENRSVNPANGVYSIGLGEVTPLMVSFSRQYYLGTQVGTDPELRPLQMLMAVPYALHAGCFPGDMLNCYTGSPETLNVGLCKGGVRTCATDGTGFGTCAGEFTPNCNGVCLDFSSNVANCGACGTVCSFANSIPACQNSNCVISSCTAGWGNCDGNSTNGCETNTSTSVTNCGSCRTVCNKTNGTPFCTGGVCNIACNTGWANCDGTLANGCEINLNSTANCGYCGNDCSSTNGAPSCTNGVCGIVCYHNYANCDGNVANGCEVYLLSNVNHCGTCATSCPVRPNATSYCSGGACGLACTSGYGNCNDNWADGCETSLSSAYNCGGCGNICLGPLVSCVDGECKSQIL